MSNFLVIRLIGLTHTQIPLPFALALGSPSFCLLHYFVLKFGITSAKQLFCFFIFPEFHSISFDFTIWFLFILFYFIPFHCICFWLFFAWQTIIHFLSTINVICTLLFSMLFIFNENSYSIFDLKTYCHHVIWANIYYSYEFCCWL